MKAEDFTKCAFCGQGVAHSNQITFYKVTIEHHALHLDRVRRRAGLEMQIGALAGFMGPNEDLSQAVTSSTVLVCQRCGLFERSAVAEIAETDDPDAPSDTPETAEPGAA